MNISIYGLDMEYKDCALEMGATIVEHTNHCYIDCEFPKCVDMFTNHNSTVSFINNNTNVGMVIDDTEFLSIKII